MDTTSNSWLDSLINAGLGAFKAQSAADLAAQQAKTDAAKAAAGATPKWLWPAVIGVGLLIVVVAGFSFLRKP